MRQMHSDAVFLESWKRLQSPTRVAGELGMQVRNVHERRRALEAMHGIELNVSRNAPQVNREVIEFPVVKTAKIRKQPVGEYKTHCVIPDVQAKSGVPLDHLELAGKYIADKKPDVIICIGDFADMPSLSSYDKGKRSAENKRYTEDVKATHHAMELLMTPIVNETGYKPRLVMTLGNHEERIVRFGDDNPAMHGVATLQDLGYEAWGWEVYPFLQPVKIDGISYCHYFYNPNTGKPYGGENLHTRLKTVGMSFTMGHQQGLSVATRDLSDGTRQRGLVAGSFYQHEEDYKGPQGNGHWRGIIMKHEVRDGNYDLMEVSLEFLRRKYG